MTRLDSIFGISQLARAGLREHHEEDGALLLMHFAFRGLVADADKFLNRHDLSRVHHRVLYVVARTDGISVGELVAVLGVTKQALHRPLKHLLEQGHVVMERDAVAHRVKRIRLTDSGVKMEALASRFERKAMRAALDEVPLSAQNAWRKIMLALARMA